MTSFLNRLKIRIFVPMNKVTDIDLQWYEAVRQDNYPAFEKLFQKYYDPLCRYAQGLLADGSLAEDVVQDMFIHFWENRIKLQVKDSLRAYFYTCIRHRIFGRRRAGNRTDQSHHAGVTAPMFESFHAECYRRKKIHRDRRRTFDLGQYRQNPYL